MNIKEFLDRLVKINPFFRTPEFKYFILEVPRARVGLENIRDLQEVVDRLRLGYGVVDNDGHITVGIGPGTVTLQALVRTLEEKGFKVESLKEIKEKK